MNFWQGEHIRLRGVEPADAEAFFHWNENSEDGRLLEFVWPPVSLAQVTDEVAALSRKKLEDDAFLWVIENSQGARVGTIRTHNCDHRNGTFSYGVHIGAEHQRKGHAAEAIDMVLRYYFEELRYEKATVQVYSFNEPSIALHEKLGFTREGTLRSMIYTAGSRHDAHWYGLTRNEWDEMSA